MTNKKIHKKKNLYMHTERGISSRVNCCSFAWFFKTNLHRGQNSKVQEIQKDNETLK